LIATNEVLSRVIIKIPVPKNQAKAEGKNPEVPKEIKLPLYPRTIS
jgi:hypothetical protein